MKDSFDRINEIHGLLSSSTELTGLLGTDPSNYEACDQRIRRSFEDPTAIDPASLPFISFGFIVGYGHTGNYKVSREPMQFLIYCANFYEASQIYKAIKAILDENYEDAQAFAVGQRSSAVTGVYCYGFRIKSFVKA